MTASDADGHLRDVFMTPLRECSKYRPKFGGSTTGVSITGFRTLYGADPLYRWIGFDSDAMYAAHRAAGGMTSVYRQLGIACERLFRAIIMQQFALDQEQVKWSYDVTQSDGKPQTLTLDARISTTDIASAVHRERFESWLAACAAELLLTVPLGGAVFEVRQGYKSADSKRQNADLRSAVKAVSSGLLPIVTVFSTQINGTVARRYRNANLLVMTGSLSGIATHDTYAFSRDVLGFDLEAFFERNSPDFHEELSAIVARLISAE